jgi:hypothetical protein
LVNQVCDHAMLLAYVAGRRRIEPANIEEAWGDLQQLPTPWTGESKTEESTGGVIEFGALDDQAEGAAGEAAVAPALRISALEDEIEKVQAEPDRQICRIEKLLAEAEDDFQPAGTIVPEIELYFDDSPHPFQEEFEQEEIVANRYAAAAGTMTSMASPPPPPLQWGGVNESIENVVEEVVEEVKDFIANDDVIEEIKELSEPMSSASHEPVCSETAVAVAPSPAAPTRRSYRHLFARLQRG